VASTKEQFTAFLTFWVTLAVFSALFGALVITSAGLFHQIF
jgi:hypothetical protein